MLIPKSVFINNLTCARLEVKRCVSKMAAAVNPDLARERKAATFDVNELSDFLYFGKEKNARRKQLGKLFEKHFTFNIAH
jgi:hypothetical protein